MNTKIFSKGTNPLSPKVNVGLKAQGKTEIFNIDMWGKGGFTKVFKCFEKTLSWQNGKMFWSKGKVSCIAYGVATLLARRQTEEFAVSHSQGTTLVTRQAK